MALSANQIEAESVLTYPRASLGHHFENHDLLYLWLEVNSFWAKNIFYYDP